MNSKSRVEIPGESAAQIEFESDRTCCVCWTENKPYQIHHIDDDPSNNAPENLAVLCFDCHYKTQLHGGFARKLDAFQVRKYREEWIRRVAAKRDKDHGPSNQLSWKRVEKRPVNILKMEEKNDEDRYSFEAEYPQLNNDGPVSYAEVNLCIAAFVTRAIQLFRVEAIERSKDKARIRSTGTDAAVWDSMAISHRISLFSKQLLSMEFVEWSYYAGAAHPSTQTRTLNFQLSPPLQIGPTEMFGDSDEYVRVLSQYCTSELLRLASHSGDLELEKYEEDRIISGAAPKASNYEHLVFEGRGIRVYFNESLISARADGRSEIHVPVDWCAPVLTPRMRELLGIRHFQINNGSEMVDCFE
jgi:hypothetical protein